MLLLLNYKSLFKFANIILKSKYFSCKNEMLLILANVNQTLAKQEGTMVCLKGSKIIATTPLSNRLDYN